MIEGKIGVCMLLLGEKIFVLSLYSPRHIWASKLAENIVNNSLWPCHAIYKSHKAPLLYPIIHHSEQKYAHFCSEWYIVGYGTSALWDLWDWSIISSFAHVMAENIIMIKMLYKHMCHLVQLWHIRGEYLGLCMIRWCLSYADTVIL